MSNPGVISLVKIKDLPYRFEIEDNIGEAIHLHIQDIRLDMTIKEFEHFADQIEKTLDYMYEESGFKCSDFNETFLFGLAKLLPDITSISNDEVLLTDMLVDTFSEKGERCYRTLEESRVLKAIRGNQAENDERDQINLFEFGSELPMSNRERVMNNLEYIKKNGYPNDSGLITLNGDNNIILDGQHRASCILYLFGDKTVPVRRLHFKQHFTDGWVTNEQTTYNGSVYYATEEAPMSENTRIDLLWSPGEKYHIDLPDGVTALRFDPIESGYYCLKSISVNSDEGSLECTPVGYRIDNSFILFGDDPNIRISTKNKKITWIEFQAVMVALESEDINTVLQCAYTDQCKQSEIQLEKTQILSNLAELEQKYKTTDAALQRTQGWLTESNNALAEMEATLSTKIQELDDNGQILQETQNQLFLVEKQLKAKCDEYDEIVNSFAWKISRPFHKKKYT